MGYALALTAFLMMIVVIGTLAIFALKIAMQQGAALSGFVSDESGLEIMGFSLSSNTLASLIASTVNTLFITLFNAIYRTVGIRLTEWENHRTESDYENSLIRKNFCFQFVNSYISFFYIAFAKPLEPNLFGLTVTEELPASASGGNGDSLTSQTRPLLDVCKGGSGVLAGAPGACMGDLVMQMLVVVVGKQFVRNLLAALIPWAQLTFAALCRTCSCRARRAAGVDGGMDGAGGGGGGGRRGSSGGSPDELAGSAKLEHESKLGAPRSMYWEYNEMAIQFGYVTMFAAAAPWAAALCMLNNAFERNLDALRMLYAQQQAPYVGASSIGAWATVFQILSYAAIVTNIAIMGLTSGALSVIYGMSSFEITCLCIALEHLLLIWKFIVQVRVAETPRWVRKAHAYQSWLVRRGQEGMVPSDYHAEALQAQYDDDEEDEFQMFRL